MTPTSRAGEDGAMTPTSRAGEDGAMTPASRAGEDGAMRLFVGVRLSVAAASAIGEVAGALRRTAVERGVQASWAAPAGLHVTLGFLGWTRPEAAVAVRDAVGRALAGASPFELATAELGCFPAAERARVLWVGVAAGARALADLAGRVGGATAALGFRAEERPYHPHVTLARMRQPTDCRALVSTPSERLRSRTWVDAVVLFESVTKARGSEYSAIAEWALEGAAKPVRRHTGRVERGHDGPEDGPGESDHGEGIGSGDERGA